VQSRLTRVDFLSTYIIMDLVPVAYFTMSTINDLAVVKRDIEDAVSDYTILNECL
jgi:hypothetical protein